MNVVRVDLHVHSSASFDCRVEPERVARRCRQLGLDPIFLTDHASVDGGLRLRDNWRRVILGQEILTTEGELMGLFLQEAVPPRLTPEETVLAIREQGGLVYLQHPYDVTRRNLQEGAIERIADQIDVVEVHNGRSDSETNRRARDLCATLAAAAGAGSDAHSLAELGRVYIEMEQFTGAADFLAKLRAGTIVRQPNRLRLRLSALRRLIPPP